MEKTQLVQELSCLENHDWFDVLDQVRLIRTAKERDSGCEKDPEPGISREAFAQWLAHRHLASDPGIREVVFLPDHCPPDVIRLVEVNALLAAPSEIRAEPVDFTPHIEGIDFQVLVADVTPDEWHAINKGAPVLPEEWSIEGCRVFGRKK